MNDPHVVALHYRIDHNETVSYQKAAPLEYDSEHFRVQIEDCRARVEMKSHFATVEDAQDVVRPLIRAWEVDAGLRYGHREIEFVFDDADVIDRQRLPGQLPPIRQRATGFVYPPTVLNERSHYPEPPRGLAVNADVDAMYCRYGLFRKGRGLLGDMANFCRTVLEGSAKGGQRSAAAKMYAIEPDVLRRLATLVSEKGGSEARKADGRADEFTDEERTWVVEAVKAIIRRAAEVGYDPTARRNQITLADLPDI